MRSHPTYSELQHQACFALARLTLLDDNKVKIEVAGGSECIATAMRTNPTNSELQYTACAALAYLALPDDNKVKIEAAGGIECIATVMRRHHTNSQLQDMTCATAGYNTEHVRLELILLFMPTTESRSRRWAESKALPVPCAAILPTASYSSAHVGL